LTIYYTHYYFIKKEKRHAPKGRKLLENKGKRWGMSKMETCPYAPFSDINPYKSRGMSILETRPDIFWKKNLEKKLEKKYKKKREVGGEQIVVWRGLRDSFLHHADPQCSEG